VFCTLWLQLLCSVNCLIFVFFVIVFLSFQSLDFLKCEPYILAIFWHLAGMHHLHYYIAGNARNLVLQGDWSLCQDTGLLVNMAVVTCRCMSYCVYTLCMCMMFSPRNVYNAGIANKLLSYYDGILKLVYKGGDSYHSSPVNRSTEIIFLCDYTAGDGRAYFKAETDHTYTFEWYTTLACLPRTVECSVTDEDRGRHYDLTRLAVCFVVVCCFQC